jgi:hypothetical protein
MIAWAVIMVMGTLPFLSKDKIHASPVHHLNCQRFIVRFKRDAGKNCCSNKAVSLFIDENAPDRASYFTMAS